MVTGTIDRHMNSLQKWILDKLYFLFNIIGAQRYEQF